MALRWEFSKKAGTVTQVFDGKEYTSNFYEGNALMIVTNEFTDDDGIERYNVIWFLTSEDGAKRFLGLAKCDDGTRRNCLADDGRVTRLTIYKEHCRYWKTLVDLFSQAFPDITIDIHAKAPTESKGGESNE